MPQLTVEDIVRVPDFDEQATITLPVWKITHAITAAIVALGGTDIDAEIDVRGDIGESACEMLWALFHDTVGGERTLLWEANLKEKLNV